ncbi:MAG TPA: DUF547 domain-containing protein [Chthoniobacterales bacterium]|nr:DUF547 domain-containing protein [Chthoniobacterales bacterium]
MKACLRFGLAVALACALPNQPRAEDSWVGEYGRLLSKYATPAGVKYAEWKNNAADMQALQKVVDAIAQEKPGGGAKDQLAFYINAYNAWILHEALEKYPTKSVKDALYTFFTGKRIKVGGEDMSFNRLEKDIIIPRFKEPRVHVALNCASRSCPPLLSEPFQAGKLEAQFEKLATGFVNSERGVKVAPDNRSAQLSKIFDWYEDDFKPVGGAVAFINKRRSTPLPNDIKISYQDYDWALNEAK